MQYRTLGNTGVSLSAIGLGCMGMSFAYGPSDEQENLAVLHRSLDLGINFWDTADMYGNGANETLLSKVLVPNRNRLFLATKFGFRFRDGKAGTSDSPATYLDGSPEWVRQAAEASLKRLKVDTIDLYYAHRVDPNVPIEETVGAMAGLVKEGKVRYLGLSEASADTIRRAHAVHPITAIQTEYSLLSREAEQHLLPTLRELGITFVPYAPLARGLFGNIATSDRMADDDFRKNLPRYQQAHLENNRKLAAALSDLAAQKGLTGSQLALAWVLAQGPDMIPIPGTRRIKYLEQNIAAIAVSLTKADLAAIDNLLAQYPDVGPRYPEAGMRLIEQ